MVIVRMKEGSYRNSNIELLRMIGMFFIVMGHFRHQADFNDLSLSVNSILISILGSGSRIAVNVFLIIGVWFMVDAKFSGRRIVVLWSQTAFYTYILTTLAILIGLPFTLKDIARGYMPFIGRALWFSSAYITLIFVSPFLDQVLSWRVKQQRLLLILSFAAICLVCTLPDRQDSYVCDTLWFWFVYLAVGYYKREVYEKQREKLEKWKWPSLITAGILYIGLGIAVHFGELYSKSNEMFGLLFTVADQYIGDIKTLPNVLCAFLFFHFTILCKERTNAVIQKIAAASFSVYIIHQTPAFGFFLLRRIYRAEVFKVLDWSVLYMIFVPVSLFAVVSVVDLGRKAIEKRWMRTKAFHKLADGIDAVYRKAEMIE